MRSKMLLFVCILLLAGSQPISSQALLLDHVDGSLSPGSIAIGQEITFHMRLQTDSFSVAAISNGFRVYSDDGVLWGNTTGAFTGVIDSSMMPMQFVTPYSCDGIGADTIGFAALIWIDIEPGLPPGFDEVVYTITIGPISSEYHGHTICLDSSFYRPVNDWRWVISDLGKTNIYPSWDGPHCFEVIDDVCCIKRGDIDHDGVGPTVADLVYLVAYVIDDGPPPPCLAEADVDGDGADIGEADLMYLMNFMFSRTNQVQHIVPCHNPSVGIGELR